MPVASTIPPTSAPSPRAARILVADDGETDRAAARVALEAAGHQVLECADGQHALETFAKERPDLVLLDVVMPRLSGHECCRILKAKTHASYLPIIMVSTRNTVNARVEGLRSGADDYLGKPYDAEELRARVEALLRVKRAVADAPEPMPPPSEDDDLDPAHRRRLDEEFDRAERYSDPLACLHVAWSGTDGPARDGRTLALRGVVDATVRKIDLVFPLGPSGFLLALPNTHFPGALAVAERIIRDARRHAQGHEKVSIGVAFYPSKDAKSVDDLLKLARAAHDSAVAAGGGKICLVQHQGYLYAPEAG